AQPGRERRGLGHRLVEYLLVYPKRLGRSDCPSLENRQVVGRGVPGILDQAGEGLAGPGGSGRERPAEVRHAEAIRGLERLTEIRGVERFGERVDRVGKGTVLGQASDARATGLERIRAGVGSAALHRVQQVAVDDPGAEDLANVLDEEPGVAVAETERVAQPLAGGDVVD